jgi:predicted transcriptional regulator
MSEEIAKSVDEVTARVNRHIHEEIEKRVTAWLQASHGVDFVEKLLNQSNATLRKHNRQMFLLIKEAYAYLEEAMRMLPTGQPQSEPPLNYKMRLLIEVVEGKAKKGPRIIT